MQNKLLIISIYAGISFYLIYRYYYSRKEGKVQNDIDKVISSNAYKVKGRFE